MKAEVERADGSPAPRVELGFYENRGAIYVVAVPAWDATSDDAGKSTASIPRTALTFTFEASGYEVTELRSGKPMGVRSKWTSTSDAAGGLVFELR